MSIAHHQRNDGPEGMNDHSFYSAEKLHCHIFALCTLEIQFQIAQTPFPSMDAIVFILKLFENIYLDKVLLVEPAIGHHLPHASGRRRL